MVETHAQARLLVLMTLALAAAAPPATAGEISGGSTPQARPWLEKLAAVYEQAFTVDYAAEIDLEEMGQPIRGTLDGAITFGDRRHSRTEMKVLLGGMPGADGSPAQAIETQVLMVHDGETLWTEIAGAGNGALQVTKLLQKDAARLAESGFGGDPSSMDPVAQLDLMIRVLDFEVVAADAGRVTLRGHLEEAKRSALGQLGVFGIDSFDLVLDAGTGFPVEIRAGNAVRMSFESFRRVDRAALPDDVFEYSAPRDVAVIDLGAMLTPQ